MSVPTPPRRKSPAAQLKDELLKVIRENPDIFNFTQNEARDGILLIDANDYAQFWINPNLCYALGFSEEDTRSFQDWQKHIFPEDFEKFQKHLQNDEKQFSELLRFEHFTGYTIWLQGTFLHLEYAGCGRELILAGFIDVTKFKKPELPLIQTLERYEHVLEGTNIGTWEWNIQTGETIFNEQWANVLGYSLKEIQPTSPYTWKRFSNPEDKEKCDALLREHFAGKTKIYESEARMLNKAGEWIWVLDKGKVVSWTADGKPEWMTGFHEEITQRKKEFERNRLFIEQAPTAIAMFDSSMNYIAASQRWLKDYKIGKRNIIGENHYQIFPNISKKWKQIHRECLKGAVKSNNEDSFITENGDKTWLSWEIRPWYNDAGQVGGLLMHTADISNLKIIERENHEKQVLLETILNSVDVGIVACDENRKLTLFNKTTKEWHGISPKETIPSKYSKNYGVYKIGDKSSPMEEEEVPLVKALKNGKIANEEILIKQKNGDSKIVNVNGSRLTDNKGNILGAVVAMHDITSRKQTEEKLRISEEAFRGNFENAAVGMAILDTKGRWLEVNKTLCDLIGYSEEEFKQLDFQEITHPEDLYSDLQLREELLNSKRAHYQWEKRYFHRNGNILYVMLSVSLVRDKNENPLYFISQIIDVTGKKVAERKLKEAIAQLEGILEASTQVSVISTNPGGIITNFNKGAENLLGYSRQDLIGKASPLLLHLPLELKLRKKELEQTGHLAPKDFNILSAIAESGKHDTREWTYIRKDGSQFPVQLTMTAIKSSKEVIGYLGVATNISKIKNVEKEIKSLLEVTKEQNQRLKNFAHIVSHNLRSHSGNLKMLLQLYNQEQPEATENEIFQLLGTASENLEETISHLNEVVLINTKTSENLIQVNLREAVNKALRSVSALAKEVDIEIKNEVDAEFNVVAIPAYMESILLNFLTNGIKYRSDERQSYIKLSAIRNENFIILNISDNGLGIDLKKYGTKIFGMYKTFHRHKEARGIGLFITKNQVEAIGGKIEVQSEVGKGTTFKLFLKH
ncbi:PAS domain S-box protein [Autumnicola musiva]|uniref:histidine kinase n=1 Tax=Autumnicola musiva TaxID=3075589 RepID=A0ABU3DB64_9FLAO|nr:PAS domain S-box protein [Zunongwangia sp. F117]MDT0678213.1 PAS domain S-box protein [Zunongwangia sp. F117]